MERDTPQQVFDDELTKISTTAFLKTGRRILSIYAPRPTPYLLRGVGRIYGSWFTPTEILKKVYYENAAQLLKVKI